MTRPGDWVLDYPGIEPILVEYHQGDAYNVSLLADIMGTTRNRLSHKLDAWCVPLHENPIHATEKLVRRGELLDAMHAYMLREHGKEAAEAHGERISQLLDNYKAQIACGDAGKKQGRGRG